MDTHMFPILLKPSMALSKELGKENQAEKSAQTNTSSYVFLIPCKTIPSKQTVAFSLHRKLLHLS